MSEISKNILKKIDEENIKPIPKWQFILLHIGLFTMFVFAILFGSLATSLMLFHIWTIDWEIVPRIGGGFHSFLYVLPYMWIVVLILMIFLATLIYKHTNKGYRVKPSMIVAISIIASLLIGSILFATKSAERMERVLRENIKPYNQYREIREQIWQVPEQGLLPGIIYDIKDKRLLILKDRFNKQWEIDITDAKFPKFFPLPKEGDQIIVVGIKTGEFTFHAEGIRPAPQLPRNFKRSIEKSEIFLKARL